MAYTAPKKGETDYERTARALNSYANSGDANAYTAAKSYADSQGWGSMAPEKPAPTSSSPVAASPLNSGGESVISGNSDSGKISPPATFLTDWASKIPGASATWDPNAGQTTLASTGGKTLTWKPGDAVLPGTSIVDGRLAVTDPDALASNWGITVPETTPIVPVPEIKKTDPLEGIWGDFLKDYAPKFVTQPTTTTPDLETYTKTIQNQLAPILETQIANLAVQRKQAKKDAENDLARRGFFGQLPSVEKLDQINSLFDNSEANLRANYLSDVMGKAFPLYSQGLASDAAAKQSYNQNMINLGLAAMNGMIDQNKFIADDAYRKAVLARLYGQDAASMFGVIGGTQ